MMAATRGRGGECDDEVLDDLSGRVHPGFLAARQRSEVAPELVADQAEKEVPEEPAEAPGAQLAAEDVADEVADGRAPRRGRAEHDAEDDREDVRRSNTGDPRMIVSALNGINTAA